MQKQNFKLENNFYPSSLIDRAIEDFQGYDIVFSQWILTISDDDPQWVFDEFSNYMLALSNVVLV